MRVSRERAQATREHIKRTAAALFRERGFDGIGVADLMKASGLSHGGFYRHFASKEDLAVEASNAAYEQFVGDAENRSIEALLSRYISKEHRDDLATGCPMATLGGEAVRQSEQVKAIFANGIETWIGMIGDAFGAADMEPAEKRASSIELAARAVGAIVLSRAASSDSSLSEEILDICRAVCLADAAKHNDGPAQLATAPSPQAKSKARPQEAEKNNKRHKNQAA